MQQESKSSGLSKIEKISATACFFSGLVFGVYSLDGSFDKHDLGSWIASMVSSTTLLTTLCLEIYSDYSKNNY